MWLLIMWLTLPGGGTSSQVVDHYTTKQACVDAGRSTIVKASINQRGYVHDNSLNYSIAITCTELGDK